MIPVSAYIPVRNDVRYLSNCLTSLFAQSHPFAEVLVIDDASEDGLEQWVKAHNTMFPVQYIRLDLHRGLAAARNEAIRSAQYDLIAAIDADCALNKYWLEILIKYITADKLAGVGGHLIENPTRRIPDLWRARNLYQTQGTETRYVDYLPGCNTLFRKEALRSVAGYNEQYYFYHEDTELGQRLRAAGWSMQYIPDAIAHHGRQDTVGTLMRRCWGYRHATTIGSVRALIGDWLREFVKGIKHFLCDVFHLRLRSCCEIDSVYFIYQAFYSYKAFREKSNNFNT